jgi:branched-chain amino acid aminotransferase
MTTEGNGKRRTGAEDEQRPGAWMGGLPRVEPLDHGSHLGALAVVSEHREGRGWQPAVLVPRAEVNLPLAGAALQGGLSVFEGLKARRMPDGELRLFRGQAHARRLRCSARRLCLADVDEGLFLDVVGRAILAHAALVPAVGEGALYIRATLLAADQSLGVQPSRRHLLAALVAPAAVPDPRPHRLWVEEDLARGLPGGLCTAKTAANHAAAVFGRERARRFGHDDALWLDGRLRRDVTQSGTMNLFAVIGDTVVTPPLDGNILAGVTRACALTLLREWQVPVEERPLAFAELVRVGAAGGLRELFGVSTSSGVAPVEEIGHARGVLRPRGGELTARLRNALTSLENGLAPDVHGWCEPVRNQIPVDA